MNLIHNAARMAMADHRAAAPRLATGIIPQRTLKALVGGLVAAMLALFQGFRSTAAD